MSEKFSKETNPPPPPQKKIKPNLRVIVQRCQTDFPPSAIFHIYIQKCILLIDFFSLTPPYLRCERADHCKTKRFGVNKQVDWIEEQLITSVGCGLYPV